MSLTKDVFFRSHVVEVDAKPKPISTYNEPKWGEFALVFDTETTLDPKEQALTFGWYWVCQLQRDGEYGCIEEGIVHDLPSGHDLDTIHRYAHSHKSEVVSERYDDRIHIYDRAEFVEKVFFEAVRNRALITAFNAPWDISRLAVGHKTSRNRGWTLILSERTSRKTGEMEPNPERPRIRATSKDSKACFFSLTKPCHPEEWPHYEIKKRGQYFCECGESAVYQEKGTTNSFCAEHAKIARKTGGR